ncbi:type II toxin-antitoxin system HicB family antitoxin [uncultured Alsobacter sp.]|uniref:type II toxin-antitoxin system HicB family antitoxin n=1 Tax=uncultured Alsobacter sp. TaxID=1748258 RepID=UPI0025D20E75|nr:type II toxin-antitoxin system HicB family antitoxin [uncultured Alsobacter sp.]
MSKDPDSAYGVFFPDAPGCFSASDDLSDLFEASAEALKGWAAMMIQSGLTIPEPRDLPCLREDSTLAEAFAMAELVIALPHPCEGGVQKAA